MTNAELKELVHLLMMCGIMDKTATESGNVTNDEWLRMKNLISKYQEEKEQPEVKGDLISRSALKEDFEYVGFNDYDDYNRALRIIDNAPTVEEVSVIEFKEPLPMVKAQKIVKALSKRTQGEWIPVSERLPEEGESVLVCLQTQGGISQYVSERFNENCWSALGGRTPLAWQPLPEPYKEGDKE